MSEPFALPKPVVVAPYNPNAFSIVGCAAITPVVYFLMIQDFTSAEIFAALGLFAGIGYVLRATRIVKSIVSISVSLKISAVVGLGLVSWLKLSSGWHANVCLAVVFCVSMAATSFVLFLVTHKWKALPPRSVAIDRWIGFGCGFLQGISALVVAVVFATLFGQLLESYLRQPSLSRTDRQRVEQALVSVHSFTESSVAKTVAEYVPWERVDRIITQDDIRDLAIVTRDGPESASLLRPETPSTTNSWFHQLRELVVHRETTAETLERIRSGKFDMNDPQDRKAAMVLFSNPEVFEMLNKTDFTNNPVRDALRDFNATKNGQR